MNLFLILFYECRDEDIKIINKDDWRYIQLLYMNIQKSIKTGDLRKDFIVTELPKKIIKKTVKVNIEGSKTKEGLEFSVVASDKQTEMEINFHAKDLDDFEIMLENPLKELKKLIK